MSSRSPRQSPRQTQKSQPKSILKVKKQPRPRRSPIVPRVPVSPDFDEEISPRSPRYTRRATHKKRNPRIRIEEDKNQIAIISDIDKRLDTIHDLKDPTNRINIAKSVSITTLPRPTNNQQKKSKGMGIFARLFGR